jgi:ribonucleoside-diphosphate reductase alpha subunit
MKVIKRNGTEEDVHLEEITKRIDRFCYDLSIDPVEVAIEIIKQLTDKITTKELDNLTVSLCASRVIKNLDYETLGSRILINSHEKETHSHFLDVIREIRENRDVNGRYANLLCPGFDQFIRDNEDFLREFYVSLFPIPKRYPLTIFAWKTLTRSYLLRSNHKIVERIEHMWFRVALFLHRNDWDRVRDNFYALAEGVFIHATPTLFHAGLRHPQLASCFLLGTDDSVSGIYRTISDCAMISKYAGGIGVHISNIRAKNTYIRGTNGYSNGIMPMLRVYNDTARYIDQGGGKRNGSFAIYIEPWHADVYDVVYAKRNIGNEEQRARDLFYGLWVCDLFMKRVRNDEEWSLMCPHQCPGLDLSYGAEFEDLYHKYESDGRYVRRVKARDLWVEILQSQIETGLPYICYKDQINRTSNHRHMGVIRSSNLCTEIMEYSDDNEYAVCNLASLAINRCLRPNPAQDSFRNLVVYTRPGCPFCLLLKQELRDRKIDFTEYDVDAMPGDEWDTIRERYDYTMVPLVLSPDKGFLGGFEQVWHTFLRPVLDEEKLMTVVRRIVQNLNRIIDLNYYPLEKTERSNKKNRPIGIGIQGLADMYAEMRISFESPIARELNTRIFETIYFASLTESCRLAEEDGTYESYDGSPVQQGILHFDQYEGVSLTHDWETLRARIREYGLRNSLMIAPMPTASTSQILGNNECFEPFTSNLYLRRTSAGEFYVMNRYMIRDLKTLGMWNQDMIDHLIYYKGSIQNRKDIPHVLRELYKTCWEISPKILIDLASDRQKFIDQSQSFNLFVDNISVDKLNQLHFYGWKKKLKTGSYYIRSRAKVSSQNFTIDPEKEQCIACSA